MAYQSFCFLSLDFKEKRRTGDWGWGISLLFREQSSKGVFKNADFQRFCCEKDGSAEMIVEVERKQMTNRAVWLDKSMDCIKDREKKSTEKRL